MYNGLPEQFDLVHSFFASLSGACLHHGMSQAQKDKVVAMATEGEIQLLLLSPEAVVYGRDDLQSVLLTDMDQMVSN